MLRLVLGLALAGALGYAMIARLSGRGADVPVPISGVPEAPKIQTGNAPQQILDELEKIGTQNRAMMEREVKQAGRP